MFFGARDDVVAETQNDSDMLAADAFALSSEAAAAAASSSSSSSAWRRRRRPRSPPADSPTTAALVRPGALPALSLVVPTADAEAADASAMQRLRLQTPRPRDDAAVTPTRCWTLADSNEDDEDGDFVSETPATAAKRECEPRSGKRQRSASPASSVGSAGSACASAVALARKRALKESVWHARTDANEEKEEVVATALDYDGDDEEHSPRVMSFVEYDAAELDHLVIAPSQDYFDGDEADAPQQTPCGFVDFRDLSQWNDESSEVFDDVICAPPPPGTQLLPPIQEQVEASPREARSPDLSSSPPPSIKKQGSAGGSKVHDAVRDENESDSEASLSDGFDILRAIGSAGDAKAAAKLQRKHRARMPPFRKQQQQMQQMEWCERRSVKRDCSFIETQCASPVCDDGVLATASDKIHRARAVSRIEELEVECIDSSDGCDPPTKADDGSDRTTRSSVFQPRLLKKRQKARQLGLDPFFRSRPCM